MSKPGNIWRKVHGKITKKPTNFSWLIEEKLAGSGMPTSSSVVITAMARKKENNEWILSPGGKQIIKSRKTGVYFLKKIENSLVISTLEDTDTNYKIFKIEQEN